MEVLVFEVAGGRWALDVRAVREVARAVAVARLPRAPAVVTGVVDVRGELAAVLDLRARLGLPPRDVDPSEMFVIARAGERTVAVRADAVEGLARVPAELLADTGDTVPSAPYAGAARLPDGLVLVHDPAAFLSEAESATLDGALAAAREGEKA